MELDAVEQRVLGSLLEKQKTVPASYPLSLNGLRTACNQTSSREPVTDYSDQQLDQCLRGLKDRELVRFVWAGKGSRALKYHQRLDEQLDLADDERALITVLLLRGPQSAGALKTRTERLFPFSDKESVEECLRRLAARDQPLTLETGRTAGQHDPRWIHLLGTVAGAADPTAPAPTVDREQVLEHGSQARNERVVSAYDSVAEAYADRQTAALDRLPFDRWLLERVAASTSGPVADVGCGPGGTTALLAAAGADVTGFDLSPAMIETARAAHPELRFEVGDLTRLLRPPAAAAWGAITAWQSLVHLAPSELSPTLGSLARVLAPGGWLAIAIHVGDEVRRFDTLWEQPFEVELVLHDPDTVRRAVTEAGLEILEWYLRGPLPDEAHTNLYLLARRPTNR
ncbi:DUF480 domain-containing protein [Naumannella sp. ID2617S]|nr:DUF480 domain-containing protein [Naumannella sp. ID2617S]